MSSPSKILLFALCVGAFVAYFGEQFTQLRHKMANRLEAQNQARLSAGQKLVYAEIKMADSGREIRVPQAGDGHYWLTLDVNGMPVRFVVDTGASHISLSYKDAETVGIDPAGLDYDRIFRTANGQTRKALVRLDHVGVDTIQFANLTASVSQPGHLEVSLLGMNFLSKLSSFKMERGELILTP